MTLDELQEILLEESDSECKIHQIIHGIDVICGSCPFSEIFMCNVDTRSLTSWLK